MSIDVAQLVANPSPSLRAGINPIVDTLVGSTILKMAAQVRALKAQGRAVCDLTVGDFNPRQFPAPEALRLKVAELVQGGETNYPPSDGMPELRQAVVDFYEARLGLRFPLESVYIASGARPPLYAAYTTLLCPGDTMVYAVPSWNNNYYGHLNQARTVVVPTSPDDGFMPTAALLAPHLRDARILHLNSPLNPCGTCIQADALRDIATLVVDENRRREAQGERPLYLLWDMVYWLVTFGQTRHEDPIRLVPEVAPYAIYVDAISKWLASTGLRVGWGVVPPWLAPKFKNLIGHIGAWAPRAEQLATAWMLRNPQHIDAFLDPFLGAVQARLERLYTRLDAMTAEGLPVRAIAPQGAIYLSVQVDLRGRTGPDGAVLRTNEQIRMLLLEQAGVAVVPFQAFGLEDETAWFRISVGAVSLDELDDAMDRLRALVRQVCG